MRWLVLLGTAWFAPVEAQVLTNGVPQRFNLPPGMEPRLFAGSDSYRVELPPGATRFEVRVVADDPDVDLNVHARLNTPPEKPGPIVEADYSGTPFLGSQANVILAARDTPQRPLQPGTYFVALERGSSAGPVTGAILAIIDTGETVPSGRLIASGVAAPFAFGPSFSATLFNGEYSYAVNVPANATRLDVAMATATENARVDLYVRFGSQPVRSGATVTADRRVESTAATKTVSLTRDDGLQTGIYYIALRVVVGGPVSGTVTATVTGPAQPPGPAIDVTPVTHDFGNVLIGQTRDAQITVRNTGGATLAVNAVTSSNPAFTVVSPPRPFTVPAGGQQAVSVRFSPTTGGTQTGTLTFASNDASRPTVPVTLIGTGQGITGPVITLSTSSLTFSTQAGANPPPQTFTVRNSGAGTLNFRVTANQPWLSVSPTQGTSAGLPVAITASVNAAGLTAGTYNGQIQVSEGVGVGIANPAQVTPAAISVVLMVSGPGGPVPAISQNGVVNAASFASPVLPNGSIARGSIFFLFGSSLGPATLTQASAFPLATALAGVSIQVTQGGTSVAAIPLAVVANQINAIMPSNAPLGAASITVTFNGLTSPPRTVQIVPTSFGAFAVNQNGMGPGILQNFISQLEQPINSARQPARPGQFVTMWGTGLGAISAPDNVAPPAGDLPVAVEVLVGGRAAARSYSGRGPCCAGLDQIVFAVPPDAPLGCFVPVIVRAGGITSNTVTMAISADGQPCSDPANPLGRITQTGGRIGAVALARLEARVQLDATAGFTNLSVDAGTASFSEAPAGEFAFNPLTSLPPPGTCSVFAIPNVDLSGLLGGNLPDVTTGRVLNAGSPLTVTGARGSITMPRSVEGSYFALLGGGIPLLGPTLPPFLEPGNVTVTGPGGPDVGAFNLTIAIPAAVNWTNRNQLANVIRSQGAILTWTGGDPQRQGALIAGGNIDNATDVAAVFVCVAPLAPGAFSVPASILEGLPPSNLQQPDETTGFLLLGIIPVSDLPRFTATGLDAGYGLFTHVSLTSTTYR